MFIYGIVAHEPVGAPVDHEHADAALSDMSDAVRQCLTAHLTI